MRFLEIQQRVSDSHGVITKADALTAGLSASSWHRAIASGRLVEVYRGAAVLPGTPITPIVEIAAAVKASGEGSMGSHRSCAYVLGVIDEGTHPIDVIRPGRPGGVDLPGVVLHRPRDLVDLRPMRHNGIMITNPLRMLCDIGAVAPDEVDRILTELRVRGMVSLGAAKGALMRHAGKGRTGISALRAAIDLQELSDRPPDSVLEEGMARFAKRFGLPAMRFHPVVAGYEVDFEVVDTPVVLECDGWEHHGRNARGFRRDKERTAAITAAGRVVVPFTWFQIVRRPAPTARRIHEIVEQWRGR